MLALGRGATGYLLLALLQFHFSKILVSVLTSLLHYRMKGKLNLIHKSLNLILGDFFVVFFLVLCFVLGWGFLLVVVVVVCFCLGDLYLFSVVVLGWLGLFGLVFGDFCCGLLLFVWLFFPPFGTRY